MKRAIWNVEAFGLALFGVGLKQNNQPDGCGKRLKPYNRSFAAWR